MVLEEKSQMLNRGKNEHVQELQVEIGKTLSEQRVRKGLTIQDVEGVTKISQSFVDDIEQGRFDRLPGKIFGRGFIKNICTLLEIDPVPVLEKYERSWLLIPEIKENKTSRPFSFFPRERKIMTSSLSPFRMNRFALSLMIPVFIVLLIMAVRYIAEKRSADITPSSGANLTESAVVPPLAQAPQVTPSAEPNTASNLPERVENLSQAVLSQLPKEDLKKDKNTKEVPIKSPLAENKKQELESQKKGEVGLGSVVLDNRAVVILNVKEEVKIKHRILPDDYVTTTFTPGVYRFPFEDRVDLLLFDASAVEVSFNNKSLGILGKKGEERKLTFFAKDTNSEVEKKRM